MNKFYLLSLMVLIPYFLMAQQPTINVKLPEILPPSPNASDLGRYGGLDVGLHTGSVSKRIPLYTLNFTKGQLPIELIYNTSGIKVDQIASRVGMGWTLNSGGVITRSVNGRPDERTTRTVLPANWSSLNQELLDFLENYNASQSLDAEPDEFSFNFNGQSGRFILDENRKPVLIQKSNLKIEFFLVNQESSSFKITTPDGTVYTFSEIELTSSNSYCAGQPSSLTNSRVPTSWYLSEIKFTNNESIAFNYESLLFEYFAGVNQVLSIPYDYNYESNICEPPVQTPSQSKFCKTSVTTWGKVLRSISYKSTRVTFNYSDRLDILSPDLGYKGEQLLSDITINENNKAIRKIDFLYTYSLADNSLEHPFVKEDVLRRRPFLMSITEKDSKLLATRKHSFVYDDINGLPQRLSLSQDLYGYYNRKFNSNFVPVPDNDADKQRFPEANADRSVDLIGTKKGSLVKINYPTGGSDSIIYSLNTYLKVVNGPVPTQTKTLLITPQAGVDIVRTTTSFSDSFFDQPDIKISAGTIVTTGSDGTSPVDPSIDLMEVSLIRQSDNVVMYSKALKLNELLSNMPVTGLVKGVLYYLQITSLYPNVRCSGSVTYPTGLSVPINVNENIGGLRIDKLISSDGKQTTIKKFYYASLDDLSLSSGKAALTSVFVRNTPSEYLKSCDYDNGIIVPFIVSLKNRSMYSNSLISLYQYSQNHIAYENVIESLGGDNFEDGGVLHNYIIQRDIYSKPLLGIDLMLGLKTSNTAWLNGFEAKTLHFKKNANQIIKLKEVLNHYKIDESVSSEIKGYIITKNYESVISSVSQRLQGFEINGYSFNSKWVYTDTTTTIIYDLNGANPVEQKSIYKYQNPLHFQLSALETKGSDGVIIQKSYAYPHEMVSSGKDQTGVYQKMILKNILSPLIEEISYKNGSTFNVKANYYETLQGLYLPKSVQTQKGTDNVETRIVYNDYDDTGNPLSVAMEKGPGICYVWGYGKRYVIAEIKNADYSIVETVLGGKNNVDQFANNLNPTNEVVNTFLASLRTDTRLKDAQVVTYTYEPLVGITSATDFKKQTTYYEYDDFQRLKYIKDADGNILKEHTYNYKQ